jgi:hypothetical protein
MLRSHIEQCGERTQTQLQWPSYHLGGRRPATHRQVCRGWCQLEGPARELHCREDTTTTGCGAPLQGAALCRSCTTIDRLLEVDLQTPK